MKDRFFKGNWPVGEDGNKVRGVELTYAKNPIEADITQSLLEAFGIPSFVSEPKQGYFSGVIFGSNMLGAILYVPETRLEEARSLLEAQIDEDPESDPEIPVQ